MEKQWIKTNTFDDIPFNKVMLLEIKVNGFESKEEAAFLQYKLLLNESILRCHADSKEKKVILIFNPLDINTESILKLIPKQLEPELKREETLSYEKLLKNTFHL